MQSSRSGGHFIAVGLFLAIFCLQVAPSLQDCHGSCEQKWDPVCGSDGKTHANKCIATCSGATVKHTGRCKTFASKLSAQQGIFTSNFATQQETFACTDNCEQKWDPVCGSDGKTYANKCIAKCTGSTVKHTGRCKTFARNFATQQETFACTDNCEQKWDPVCGSDGKTYANKCIAKCAGATVKHTGRCKTFARNFATQQETFACTDNCEQKWDPVCGSDGKTYANKCIAKCAGATVKHTGRCKTFASKLTARKMASNLDAVPTSDRKILCSGVYNPVCGEDNRTYSNACMAARANVGIKHPGPCMR